MFKMPYFADDYDYLEQYSPIPPEEMLKSGASSDDYIKARYQALTVNCELPYFYDSRIEDDSPSDMTRRQAVLAGIEHDREVLRFVKEKYEQAKPLLTVESLFVDAIEEYLRTGENDISTLESAVKKEEEYQRQATHAEKWDALSLRKFYNILYLGQFIRLLEFEKARNEERFPKRLQEILDDSLKEFEGRATEAERQLDYTVVPIKKLASIQLLTALYGMDYVQRHPDFAR
jgi:hypothetical protein